MLTPACVSAGLVLVLGFAACQSTADELPPIPKPLGYATVHVDLPGCPDRLPPVHDVARCSPDDIGTRIDSRDVCRVLMGLKDWVEYGRTRLSSVAPSDWQFVRSSCVSRGMVALTSEQSGSMNWLLTDHWPCRRSNFQLRVLLGAWRGGSC